MIFVCLGSREYQFNRLLKKIDQLVQNGVIEDVFAQIGESNYTPVNYNYVKYLDTQEFQHYQETAEIIISHGGTGALVGALKKEKLVIAAPRLQKFGEHIDDHQTEVAGILESEGYLRSVTDMEELENVIYEYKDNPNIKAYDKESNALSIIKAFINSN